MNGEALLCEHCGRQIAKIPSIRGTNVTWRHVQTLDIRCFLYASPA